MLQYSEYHAHLFSSLLVPLLIYGDMIEKEIQLFFLSETSIYWNYFSFYILMISYNDFLTQVAFRLLSSIAFEAVTSKSVEKQKKYNLGTALFIFKFFKLS